MIREIKEEDYSIITNYYREFDLNNVDLFHKESFIKIYIYEDNKKICFFINYSIIYDRAEINYIYVDEIYRNNHVASKLLEFMIDDCIHNNCNNITLEVAEKNIKGINLYIKFGFEKKAIRKNYYKDCDGILMMKELINNE